MPPCESLITSRDGKKLREPIPCGANGMLYKVRLPKLESPMLAWDKAIVKKDASASVECVLCDRHKAKAIAEGKEVIPA